MRFGEPAGHAEVEQRGAAVGLHHQVPAVQVAVEDAIDHRAFERRDQAGLQQRVGVDAGRVHGLDVVEREAAETFHDQDPFGHERGVRPGHDDAALFRLRQHVRDVEHVLRLEPEVELLDNRLREQFDQRRRVGQGGDRNAADEPGREPRQRGDVVAEQFGDARPLHLDHDFLARDQPGRVHLRDRSGGDRSLVEPFEQLAERTPEVDFDDGADVGERFGRHLVAQELELRDQLVGEQAFAARDDLAELHVARAEALERATEPSRDAGARRRTPPLERHPPGQRAADGDNGPGQATEGREPTRREQTRNFAARPPPDAVDVPLPRDLIAIEHPRPVIAERTEGEVGRPIVNGVLTERGIELGIECGRVAHRRLGGGDRGSHGTYNARRARRHPDPPGTGGCEHENGARPAHCARAGPRCDHRTADSRPSGSCQQPPPHGAAPCWAYKA